MAESTLLERFILHLRSTHAVTMEGVAKAQKMQHQLDSRIGALATMKGFLRPKDVFSVVASQLSAADKFGDIAIAQGVLTAEQRDLLLAIQKDPFPLFVEALWLGRAKTEKEARTLASDFIAALPPEVRQASEALQASITGVRQRGDSERVRTMLTRVKKLATLPIVVQKILGLIEDPEVRLEKVAAALQGDAALSAQVLRLVNSAYYGLRGKVTTPLEGVKKLGLNSVRDLVLTASVINQFKGRTAVESRKLWSKSIQCAQWAVHIAKHVNMKNPELAQSAGLLHAVGKLVVEQQLPTEAQHVAELVKEDVPIDAAESEVFGLTIPEIGGYLTHFWNFPDGISQGISFHRTSLDILRSVHNILPTTSATNAACTINDLVEAGGIAELVKLPTEFHEHHAIERAAIEGMAPKVKEAADNLMSVIF